MSYRQHAVVVVGNIKKNCFIPNLQQIRVKKTGLKGARVRKRNVGRLI